jgi:RimJ/RimL family protein N-acetyltransferase
VPERVVLQGSVVRLDPLAPSDLEGLVEAALEDRSSYGYTMVPATPGEMPDYVASALEDERTGWALPFAIRLRHSGRIVGSTRFLDLAYWADGVEGQTIPSVAEIGSTWMAASAQRTAANTECKLLLLTHAFETWQVARVTLKTDARNERSRRAIERIGATFEGIRRAHVPATGGTVRDSAYYSILCDEWPGVRDALVHRLHATRDRRP